jgi:hypothetical protein
MNNLILKIKKNNLIVLGLFLVGLSSFNFYFFDPFYYPVLLKIFILIGLSLLIMFIVPRKISYLFLLYLFFILYYNYSCLLTHFSDQKLNNLFLTGSVFIIFFVYVENIVDRTLLIKSINLIIWFFVVINTISFIVYILFALKIPLPHVTINLGGRGLNYDNYSYFLIVCNYLTADFGSFVISRFNGLFEEPGMLGTYVGIILMMDCILFPKRKLTKFVLITLGIFTASFAFFIFAFLVLIYELSFKILFRLAIVLSVFVLLLLDFMSVKSLEYLNFLTINRVTLRNGEVVGNTRHADQIKFEKYIYNAKPIELIFGNGKGKNNDKEANYSSYASIIYELGFIGAILFLLLHIYYLIFIPIKYQEYKYLLLTIIPIISIYQGRQMIDFFTILYFVCIKNYFSNLYLIQKNKILSPY